MNGDSYSSRSMATNALPRIRKHETDTNNPTGADSGRHGSSRDHYVSTFTLDLSSIYTDEFCVFSPQEMIVETETETTTEAAREDARGLQGIVIHDAESLM